VKLECWGTIVTDEGSIHEESLKFKTNKMFMFLVVVYGYDTCFLVENVDHGLRVTEIKVL
jgi:hypothetical protein